jgi:hypothetical protein
MTKAEVEQAWIDAWNELYALLGARTNVVFLLPDWQPASLEECQGFLQSSVYNGYHVHVAEVWYKGDKAIQVSRTARLA